eukprot:236097_1
MAVVGRPHKSVQINRILMFMAFIFHQGQSKIYENSSEFNDLVSNISTFDYLKCNTEITGEFNMNLAQHVLHYGINLNAISLPITVSFCINKSQTNFKLFLSQKHLQNRYNIVKQWQYPANTNIYDYYKHDTISKCLLGQHEISGSITSNDVDIHQNAIYYISLHTSTNSSNIEDWTTGSNIYFLRTTCSAADRNLVVNEDETLYVGRRRLPATISKSECDFIEQKPFTLKAHNKLGEITIGEVVEIRFKLSLKSKCVKGWCNILTIYDPNDAVGRNIRSPAISISNNLAVAVSDKVKYNSNLLEDIEADEMKKLRNKIYDGDFHQYYFKSSPTERIFAVDDIVYAHLNGSYDTSICIGNTYDIYASAYFQNVLNGTMKQLCIKSYYTQNVNITEDSYNGPENNDYFQAEFDENYNNLPELKCQNYFEHRTVHYKPVSYYQLEITKEMKEKYKSSFYISTCCQFAQCANAVNAQCDEDEWYRITSHHVDINNNYIWKDWMNENNVCDEQSLDTVLYI